MLVLPLKRECVRHPTFYFPDGDIILAAPTIMSHCSHTGPHVSPVPEQLFRLHRFMLIHHSPVFADIFTLPTPTESTAADELYDGVPIVQMSDRADDLASLLNVLYDPSTLLLRRRDPQTPFFIEGILRLATKYQMDRLRDRILEHFTLDWPQSIEEWELFQAERDITCAQHSRAANGQIDGLYADDRFPDPAPAICLAHQYHCPEVLPAAYYCAVQISARNSWNRMRMTDVGIRMLERGQFSVRWNLLQKRDMDRLSLGREILLKITNGLPPLFGSAPDDQARCLSPKVCNLVRVWQRNLLLSLPKVWDPLEALYRLTTTLPPFEDGLCTLCKSRQDALISAKKAELWNSLPAIFGIESA